MLRMRKLAIAVAMLLCSCTDDEGGAAGVDAGPACTSANDACSGETVCVAGACVAAFPRIYRIANVMHMVPTTMVDGTDWDASSGGTAAPDLFVAIRVNGATVATTAVVADSYTAMFAGPYSVELVGGSSLQLQSFDEDLADDDAAYTCGGVMTASLLRAREIACAPGAWSMALQISPQ